MVSKKSRYIFLQIISLILLVMIAIPFIKAIDSSEYATYADAENNVYFEQTHVEANDSGLIYVELKADGVPGQEVVVFYHTEGGTAIPGIDYKDVSNSITLKIGSDGMAVTKLAFKCTNVAADREKIRLYDNNRSSDVLFGRYFKVIIDSAKNASVYMPKSTCICSLPYGNKVSATTNIASTAINAGEVAYIDDYKTLQAKYHKGDKNIDGKETWKSWKNGGISFENDTTRRWVNTYIANNYANMYGSFMIRVIDNSTYHSSTDIKVYAGNKELMSNFKKESDGPGCYLYLSCEPHAIDDADRIDGRVMYLVSQDKNPYKEDSDYVDVKGYRIADKSGIRRLYWIQSGDAWYASNNSLYNSMFYKINPYNGVYDSAVAVYNKNREVDIEAKDIWVFMTLIDDICPTVVGSYVDDSLLGSTGKLRLYVRFNEPVYSSKKHSLSVRFNNSSIWKSADYVAGNYSDTLVYEIAADAIDIKSITYQLPSDDIGDMSYNLDSYKNIKNNKVQNTDQNRNFEFINGPINNITPKLAIDLDKSSNPNNIYNLLISMNDNGALALNRGTIYYDWTTQDTKTDKLNPNSYSKYYELKDEDLGSTNLSFAKNPAEGIESGIYYLHALAVSPYGLKNAQTYGPYVLDGDPPSVTQNAPSRNDLREKEFLIETTEKFEDTKELSLIAKYKDASGTMQTKSLKLVENGSLISSLGKRIRLIQDTEPYIYKYSSNINEDETDPEIPIDTFIQEILGSDLRLNVDISFILKDRAGNSATSNSMRVIYDRRAYFEVNTNITGTKITDIETTFDAYDISEGQPSWSITIDLANPSQDLTPNSIFSVLVNGEAHDATTPNTRVVISDLEPGFYELVPRIRGEEEGTIIDLISKSIRFYLTDGMKDKTTNYDKINSNLVLSNKVYQLQDARYYYLNEDGTVVNSFAYGSTYNDVTGKYDGGSITPAFSNVNEAKKYVKFMEYRDMLLVSLTANMASLLNSNTGSTIYSKAANETMVAQEGQLWIRYKRATWTTSSSSFGWAFYYYGNGLASDGININSLSTNLDDALSKIVNKIAAEGKDIYLVEDETLNQKTGAPYLPANQLHVNIETAETSMAGSTYLTNPTYNGDSSIYKNTVRISDVDYALATNLVLDVDENSDIYYKYLESTTWEQLSIEAGQSLSDVFGNNASGIYFLREYSTQGVNEYKIYYDKQKPTLTVNINGVDTILDGTVSTISGSSAIIKSLNAEIDPYGYVAIYTYPTKVLKDVLYAQDLLAGGYELDSANYYLQVGDRSGNNSMFTVLLSTSNLEVTAEENSTNSGIYVKVLNREEREIYSYEVYLNEQLLTSEFAETRLFKDPGIYRIVVVDIYGNTVSTTKEFEFASPTITWYYLNTSGSYSKYDSSKPVSMVIKEDETSTRISNVYTSTLVRIMFNTQYGDNEVKFEMLDLLPSEYTYSEASNAITINALTGWRMRVWYADYPENDHMYVCKIDTEAPDFKATFVGTSTAVYVEYDEQGHVVKTSSVDNIDLTNYEVDDIVSVDTLAYTVGTTTTIPFFTGNVINGNHIIIALNDPSDIKSYSVTRNGQPVTAVLDADGQLILNGYGTYVINAIDSLGNSGVFRFVNTKDPISQATIDGNELKDSKLTYGNHDVIVQTQYAGTTSVLLNNGEEKSTYVFEFDGSTITYGRYMVTLNEDDESEQPAKIAEYVVASGFYLNINDENVRRDKWYDVITTEDYIIQVMFNSASQACYRVECEKGTLQTEVSFSVGNNVFPSYYTTELSKNNPEVTLLTGGEPVEILPESAYIYIAKDLTIDQTNISEDITTIKVSYAKLPNFYDFETIYENGAFTKDFVGDQYGFYAVLVTNKYNTNNVYIVSRIDAFVSQVTVTYLDGTTRDFATNDKIIYSNAKIDLIVYSQSVHFEVNGVEYSGISKDGTQVLELDTYGTYNVSVVSANGIKEIFNFVIGTNPEFVFEESWISGYNEEALLRDQGYTNKVLSVEAVMGVEYVDIIHDGGDPKVIYDNISEDPINNPYALLDSIGVDGPGEYLVRFRNLNGDLTTKTIHFSDVPSLELARKIVANPNTYVDYDIKKAIEENFYSNYVMRFSTNSSYYDFKVNGNAVTLDTPWYAEFSATSGNGSFEYDISYLDEYGNKAEFKAILYRADVIINTDSMTQRDINGTLYTKDNISITFSDDLSATLVVNDRDPVVYKSGDTFYKDGTYVFTVEDIAGNRNVFTIVHKSVNAYQMIDATSKQEVIQGGVVNNTTVQFEATDDSTLKSIFRNGKKMDSYSNKTFASTGHWEVLIEDSVGNQAYSEFYIINNSLAQFEYTAPYGYKISEIWYTDKKGQRSQIEVTGDTISLTENGDYAVVVLGIETTTSFQFSVQIDNTPPNATLNGVEDGGTTARDVTLKGLKVGDIVEIYKNGKLVETTEISLSTESPQITTGGDYRIVVTNIQGATVEYNFTRKNIANAAASIFIIILCLASVIGVAIGLVYHTGLKTDS
ncbi:MAG: hypothetical protein E7338_06365 [Clostridiales bacterium]|nr:hypothetical protein [Clostridiales bacterium]